jgi:hypothetical protein
VNQHTVGRDTPEQARCSPEVSPRPESSECLDFFSLRGTFGTLSERITGGFCESSIQFIHSQIITATIELEGRMSRGAPSLFFLVLRISPRRFPKSRTAETNTILVRCEEASMHPHGRRLVSRGGSGRGRSTIGARPDSTTRCGRVVAYGFDQGADM